MGIAVTTGIVVSPTTDLNNQDDAGHVTNYFILLETGDYVLLETGDKIIIE